jgi:hypothetical protein
MTAKPSMAVASSIRLERPSAKDVVDAAIMRALF